jgi:hypothetical protein
MHGITACKVPSLLAVLRGYRPHDNVHAPLCWTGRRAQEWLGQPCSICRAIITDKRYLPVEVEAYLEAVGMDIGMLCDNCTRKIKMCACSISISVCITVWLQRH